VEDYSGIVVQVKLLGKTYEKTASHHMITVGAGENWHAFVSWCLENEYYGLENLALIPGTVGAAPIQNIGAYGVEVESFIYQVEYLDRATGELIRLNRDECNFGYRDSIFKHALFNKAVITNVTFSIPRKRQPVLSYGELSELTNPTANEIFNKVIAIRQSKLPDPNVIGNAGSFFKNPVISHSHYQELASTYPLIPGFNVEDSQTKVPAAWLIDQAGFKGQVRGGIQCHPQQALVLTNYANGTGTELIAFAREIVADIGERFGIQLENEVRLIGRDGLIEL
jgi:UDP-N-acetylmuramate dehydrogenase